MLHGLSLSFFYLSGAIWKIGKCYKYLKLSASEGRFDPWWMKITHNHSTICSGYSLLSNLCEEDSSSGQFQSLFSGEVVYYSGTLRMKGNNTYISPIFMITLATI